MVNRFEKKIKMRDPKRIKRIVEKLSQYWESHPDLRLGQIIENSKDLSDVKSDTFYIEDDDLEKGLDVMISN